MTFLADIYVLKKTRSSTDVVSFLDEFLPRRVDMADLYEFPLYADDPEHKFRNSLEITTFLEKNITSNYSIYWQNSEINPVYKFAMCFYTKNGSIIFGLSLDSNQSLEKDCLTKMKRHLDSELGYVDHENPPSFLDSEFIEKCLKP